jgi:hypothetical protein
VNCPIAREIFAATAASDSAIEDGVLMVGVADLRYVLNCRICNTEPQLLESLGSRTRTRSNLC